MTNFIQHEWTEAKETSKEIGHWLRDHHRKRTLKKAFQLKYIWYWIAAVILIAGIVLLAVYRDTIVRWFEPRKQSVVDFPVSWLFPVLILIVLSFPPLGGHEVVILVVGLIWGIWKGFAIACAGTVLGELATFYAFKYLFTAKAAKIEEEKIFYACLARLMREGGLWIITVIRFSALPGHVVTAIQSTVGIPLWVYLTAVVITLPKQLAVVYLGYMFGETDSADKTAAQEKKEHQQKIVSRTVVCITFVMTFLALYIVYRRARALYPVIEAEMAEKAKCSRKGVDDEEAGFEVASLSDITLTDKFQVAKSSDSLLGAPDTKAWVREASVPAFPEPLYTPYPLSATDPNAAGNERHNAATYHPSPYTTPLLYSAPEQPARPLPS